VRSTPAFATGRGAVLVVSLCALVLSAAPASAQTPSQAGYGETPLLVARPLAATAATGGSGTRLAVAGESGAARTQERGAVAPRAGVLDSSGGRLPFTGMDLGIIALVAVVLLGSGFGLRRATASPARA